ncbi:hypothetical protein B0T20DRAFT_180863 [Sordaria brevicollis]|uniref:Uncharacterized protein n=1 Tax=Sordaria brevicollis TaxID=83679 RepID=A0AAE0UDN0_SORBR|nr:hypothetical protein B0T20DRAFT_180863 [Sordaria brevicollis]
MVYNFPILPFLLSSQTSFSATFSSNGFEELCVVVADGQGRLFLLHMETVSRHDRQVPLGEDEDAAACLALPAEAYALKRLMETIGLSQHDSNTMRGLCLVCGWVQKFAAKCLLSRIGFGSHEEEVETCRASLDERLLSTCAFIGLR